MPKEIKPDLPSTVATGTGAGLAAGGGYGLLKNLGKIKAVNTLEGQLPVHEANIAKVRPILDGIRKQYPDLGKLSDRRLTNVVLKQDQLPNEMYHTLRKGLDSFSGRSRSAKLIQLLKKQKRNSLIRHGLIGTGLGLGTGLLAATSLGHFDKAASNLVNPRGAVEALSGRRVREATQGARMFLHGDA